MSWSVTVNDIGKMTYQLPESVMAQISRDNPLYEQDASLAFALAKAAELSSATLAGGRTPSPYGGPDTVVFSVVGFASTPDSEGSEFNETMTRTITSEADTSGRPEVLHVPDGAGEERGSVGS